MLAWGITAVVTIIGLCGTVSLKALEHSDKIGRNLGDSPSLWLGILGVGVVLFLAHLAYRRIAPYATHVASALKAKDADQALEDDPRPPIVYLRSFADDTGLNPAHEAEIVEALSPFGPVVAIGRPGETLQTLGAYRVYVSDDDWQEQVLQWVGKASLVVLRIGLSQGLGWEIRTVLGHGGHEKLLLQIPGNPVGEAVEELDRIARFVCQGDHDCDFEAASYLYFHRRRPRAIAGALGIPAEDIDGSPLNAFYRRYFREEYEAIRRRMEAEEQWRRNAGRRRLLRLLALLGVLVVLALIVFAL